MSETTKVRTTIRPDEEIEVGQAEFLDLKRQGLLVDDDSEEAPAQADTSTEEENN